MYSTWNLKELKAELKRRGANQSGRKADLVDRLEAYDKNFNFGNDVVSQDSQSSQQLETPNADLYRDINSSTTLPKLTKQHIQSYFDQFNKGITDAEKLYESRYLLVLRSAPSGPDTFVKGYCKASMKLIQYEVNIKIRNDGMPEEANCECAAGEGKEAHCKHVGVVLLGVQNMVKDKFVLLNEVSTQKLQTFHQPKRKYFATPLRASKLPSKRHVGNIIFSPYLKNNRFDKKAYEATFRSLVLNFPSTSMPIKQLYKPANTYALVHDHLYEKNTPVDTLLDKMFLQNVTAANITSLEVETRGQRRSSKWLELRKTHITASIFHTVCHLRDTTLVKYAEQIMNKKSVQTKAITHGIIHEKSALNKYCENTGLDVQECGLFLSNERPYLGASPDGLLGSETVIEIKCPYTTRYCDITPTTVPYLKYDENNLLTLKRENIYYYQVQGQLYVTNRKYCNLIIYTFKDMKVIFLERDDTFIQNMLPKLDSFYYNFFRTAVINKYSHKDYNTLIKPQY